MNFQHACRHTFAKPCQKIRIVAAAMRFHFRKTLSVNVRLSMRELTK